MKDKIEINGVTLTRAQVEQALKDLNSPALPKPGSIWRSKRKGSSPEKVTIMRNDGYILKACVERLNRDYPAFKQGMEKFSQVVNYTDGDQWFSTPLEFFLTQYESL